ncbi:MAG: hypothetical protein JWP47_2468 [Polaromonas sp.]|jgi:hypothetical protein|nr:hypothetical protein [Polaromonas sp.]
MHAMAAGLLQHGDAGGIIGLLAWPVLVAGSAFESPLQLHQANERAT